MRRLLRRLADRDARVLDATLALALLLAAWAQIAVSERLAGPPLANVAVVAAAALSLVWRRSHPVAVTAWIAACTLVMHIALTPPPAIPAAAFLLIVASYSAGAHAAGRWAWAALAIVVSCVLVTSILENPRDVAFPVVIFGAVPWVVGRTLRGHTALARDLAEQAERSEHLRAQEAHDAVAAEQARVARELHDVLAHNLSVMVIQAAGARRIVDRDPQAARDAALLIAHTGRDTLTELRRLFGAVHHGDGEALDGSPGLAHLDRLAERARRAGLSVSLRVHGAPSELGRGVDLAAYRVVQEALTNTLKHAGQVRAAIDVRHEPGHVTVEIVDNGARAGHSRPLVESGGHGLLGMRERVCMYGGVLEAGPREQGGFRVMARLPVQRAEVSV